MLSQESLREIRIQIIEVEIISLHARMESADATSNIHTLYRKETCKISNYLS